MLKDAKCDSLCRKRIMYLVLTFLIFITGIGIIKENQAYIEYSTQKSLFFNPGDCMLKNTTIGIKENLEFHVYFQGENKPHHVIAATEKGIIIDESKGTSLNGKLLDDIYKKEDLIYSAKIINNNIKVLILKKTFKIPYLENT